MSGRNYWCFGAEKEKEKKMKEIIKLVRRTKLSL